LKSEKRTFELQRHRSILFATIDYIIEKVASENLPKVDFENIADYYRKQKQQIDNDFEIRGLYLLKKRLNKLTDFPIRRVDLTFSDYIELKTGYQIDIFESLKDCVEKIIHENKIQDKKQLNDLMIIINLYEQQSIHQNKVDILKNLLIQYFDKIKTANSIKI